MDAVRNGKRAKSGFRKEGRVKALIGVQGAAHRSDVITSDKIKKKAGFSQAKMGRVDQIR